MKFSSALVLLSSAAALAAPGTVRRQSATNVLENGSFESGSQGWTLAGGASVVSNSDENKWRFTAPEGTHFALLTWDNQNSTQSSIAGPATGLSHTSPHTLSFDWRYLVASTGRGPPSIDCTLTTSLNTALTMQSWTRRASIGGSGSVKETFDANTSGGTVTIKFECAGDAGTAVVNAGVAIDNVQYSGTLA